MTQDKRIVHYNASITRANFTLFSSSDVNAIGSTFSTGN